MKPEIEDRLNRSDIQVGAEGPHYCMFVRDNCMAMAPCDRETFTGIGSTGIALDRGLAYLVWRDGRHLLAGNDFEVPANPEQVQQILRFSADLKLALGLAE